MASDHPDAILEGGPRDGTTVELRGLAVFSFRLDARSPTHTYERTDRRVGRFAVYAHKESQ